MLLQTLALLAGASVVSAWMPGQHKEIYARDGSNLFNSTSSSKRWLPGTTPIRGVNLGSLFVFEPWIASGLWSDMGCGAYNSEFDCVSGLGQAAANTAFQKHWGTWYTEADFAQMVSYGINTVRIPVGYWMMESIVYADSEHFPQGGIQYLETICRWATAHGLYIIIDLHGAPGAQVASNPDTGQYAPTPGFYVDYQFNRALEFLGWMTNLIHTNSAFANVGMLEIVNEPIQNSGQVGTLTSTYYPNAFTTIRNAESALGVTSNNYLHIQMMNQNWGSGDPTAHLTNNYFASYDDHRYLKYDTSVAVNQAAYLAAACSDTSANGNWPTIVGEFSLSPPTNVQSTGDWDLNTQKAFYKKWFAAATTRFEADSDGWIFWSWKTQLNDYRWDYSAAVAAGVVPTSLGEGDSGIC